MNKFPSPPILIWSWLLKKEKKVGEDFQSLTDKHSRVIVKCQLKPKSLVIEAGDLDLVEKKNLAITSFVESVHDISEGFLMYDYRKDINAHQCSIGVIEFYTNHLSVNLDNSKEIILE